MSVLFQTRHLCPLYFNPQCFLVPYLLRRISNSYFPPTTDEESFYSRIPVFFLFKERFQDRYLHSKERKACEEFCLVLQFQRTKPMALPWLFGMSLNLNNKY